MLGPDSLVEVNDGGVDLVQESVVVGAFPLGVPGELIQLWRTEQG